MNLFRGSWNVNEDDTTPVHSPVRLLQKLAAYRISTASTSVSSSPSPSPLNERKSTILSESTNFFTRLWRPNTRNPTPSPTLIASHETASTSFDNVPDSNPTFIATTSGLSRSPRLNRRISFIREVIPKHQLEVFPFPPIQPQPTVSSTVTDPSFEDISSEQSCNTTREFCSQSFETNIDSSYPGIDDEEQELTFDERHRRLSLSAQPVIPLKQQISSSPMRITEQQHSDSLASPDANIDVSMVSSNYSSTVKKTA